MQPAVMQVPPLHCWPAGQSPQSSLDPQPLPIAPQYLTAPPDAQVSGMQLGPPRQTLAVHTSSPEHPPQSSACALQPLPIMPQYWPPDGWQLTVGVQGASMLMPASVPLVPDDPNVPATPVMMGPPPVPVVPLTPV